MQGDRDRKRDSETPSLTYDQKVEIVRGAKYMFPSDGELRKLGYTVGAYPAPKGRPQSTERWLVFAGVVDEMVSAGHSVTCARLAVAEFIVKQFPPQHPQTGEPCNQHLYGALSQGYASVQGSRDKQFVRWTWDAKTIVERARFAFLQKLRTARRVKSRRSALG